VRTLPPESIFSSWSPGFLTGDGLNVGDAGAGVAVGVIVVVVVIAAGADVTVVTGDDGGGTARQAVSSAAGSAMAIIRNFRLFRNISSPFPGLSVEPLFE
jgi:hypothetical protein